MKSDYGIDHKAFFNSNTTQRHYLKQEMHFKMIPDQRKEIKKESHLYLNNNKENYIPKNENLLH